MAISSSVKLVQFNKKGFTHRASLAISNIVDLAAYITPNMTTEELNLVKQAEHEIITNLSSLPTNTAELKQYFIAKDAAKILEKEVRDFLLSGKSTMDAVIKFNTTYDLVNRVCREMREAASMYIKPCDNTDTNNVS